jgi:hypothetical protein
MDDKELLSEMLHEILNEALEIHLTSVHEEMSDFREEMQGEFKNVRKEMRDGFLGMKNEVGGAHNRIDNETFARKDLEQRIRKVLPKLPEAATQ